MLTAATPHPRWQAAVACTGAVAFPAGLALVATGQSSALAVLLTIPFAVIVLIRWAALVHLAVPWAGRRAPPSALKNEDLPVYSVLLPLYDERDIAPDLVQALRALDYPPDKLEILFITEAHDAGTRAALMSAVLSKEMRILTVPAGTPRTKPRALNYALMFARGDLIAVYDAEDVPCPQQLRLAAGMFAASDPDLVCVQARLSICDPGEGFLARQFALEYASLFEAILPALERLGLPILLGGTSNHFRRADLEALGAWDSYNVTEDADLGVRISRAGKRVAMLDSETREDAPGNAGAWLGQRTRWLKGWMVTYLVHMRQPAELLRNLGLWRFLGFQAMLGGMILSALVHPWFYAVALLQLYSGQPVFAGASGVWAFCWFSLIAGYVVGIALGLVVAWRSAGRVPLLSALLVPLYWLAISAASYRALRELVRRPHHWEKTPHAARTVTPGAVSP